MYQRGNKQFSTFTLSLSLFHFSIFMFREMLDFDMDFLPEERKTILPSVLILTFKAGLILPKVWLFPEKISFMSYWQALQQFLLRLASTDLQWAAVSVFSLFILSKKEKRKLFCLISRQQNRADTEPIFIYLPWRSFLCFEKVFYDENTVIEINWEKACFIPKILKSLKLFFLFPHFESEPICWIKKTNKLQRISV